MDDIVTYAFLITTFFFVAVALALLLRYRQVSQRINTSTDLGRDLWSSLEQRLKKQDGRILDMMGRLEVVQSRVTLAAAQVPVSVSPLPPIAPPALQVAEKTSGEVEQGASTQQLKSQKSQLRQVSHEGLGSKKEFDETQLAAMRLLGESSLDTRQLTKALKKSREHTARIMKRLFDLGLVRRNDSMKPFVYQLTDEGKRQLTGN